MYILVGTTSGSVIGPFGTKADAVAFRRDVLDSKSRYWTATKVLSPFLWPSANRTNR